MRRGEKRLSILNPRELGVCRTRDADGSSIPNGTALGSTAAKLKKLLEQLGAELEHAGNELRLSAVRLCNEH